MMRPQWWWCGAVCALGCSGAWAQATADAQATLPTQPLTWSLSQETWRLPAGETLGMTGGSLWWGASEELKLGVATYGATRGQRGGFITLGVAGELQHRLSPTWRSTAGLFVGAGGGRGGQPLAGGGLMLRTDVGLGYELPWGGLVGAGVSHVRFPDGTINSTQPYLRYDHRFHSLWTGGRTPPELSQASSAAAGPAALALGAQQFSLVARDVRWAAPVVGTADTRMQLLGVEWSADLDPSWFVKLGADGAMGGQSSGYMQILAGGGYRLPLWQGGTLKLHASAGPAGGGGLDTRGGLIWDAGVTLQQQVSRHDSLALAWGQAGQLSGQLKGEAVALKWVHHFATPKVGTQPVPVSALQGLKAHHLRIRLAQQSYLDGAPGWRNSFAHLDVDNLGVQLDYFWSPPEQATQWFATGQGLAAYKGQAGAYMTGLLGLGAQRSLGGAWFAESEALVGAAGGGGLATGGGLVGQINASLGYRWSKRLSILGSAGTMAAFRGDFRVKVWGLGLAYDLTAFAGP